jgi:1-acyl-sn-glycerol-3-phosphate acyltransferase
MAREIGSGIKASFLAVHNFILVVWALSTAILTGGLTTLTGVVSRKFARSLARLWCRQVLFFTGVKLIVKNASNIDKNKNYVFVANHQGYFDIPVIYTGLGSSLSFIAKKELFRIPFFGWGIAAIGCVSMDRKNPRKARAAISRAAAMLRKDNLSLVLFPEGTRSPSGIVSEFKRGSFTLALEAGVPVVPITICGTAEIHSKASFKIHPGSVTLTIGAPITMEEIGKLNKEELSTMTRDVIITTMEKHCRQENASVNG